jgi:ATP-dependent Clp protease ATP-binding subunit ClpB
MRFDKFTIKSQELIQNAQTLASQHHNQQIEPEHLLATMLGEHEGITRSIFRKMGVSPGGVDLPVC